MKNYWVSWLCPTDRVTTFELEWPWWKGPTRLLGEEAVCAAIKAESKDDAKRIVIESYDKPQPKKLEWRFVDEKPDDWSPFSDRFPRDDLMVWPDGTPDAEAAGAPSATHF